MEGAKKIKIYHLVKNYQETQVIQGINIEFELGKTYGIIGRNGSGKSVFLKLLLGVLSPTSGYIYIPKNNSEKQYIGAVIDGCDLFMDLTGMQNLTYLANFRKVIGKEEMIQVLEKVGLDAKDKRKIRKYSLGMKKRLLIAQAIMEQPDILILDEPTNSLDSDGIVMLHKVVEEAKKRGTTIFMASHYKEDIEKLCDIVYEMKEGRLC